MSSSLRKPSTGAMLGLFFACLFVVAAPSHGKSSNAPEALQPAISIAEKMPRLHSLLVSKKGGILLERYFNGRKANDLANVKSVSKSIVSSLVGIAIAEGHISGVNQEIADFFPEHSAFSETPAKRAITIANLLSMQSGLQSTSSRNYGRWVANKNWVDFALAQPLLVDPGTRMIYSTGNTHLLSAIITKASGQSTLAFAREHLFAPLGFHLASWPRDPQGIYFGGNNMELTPRQLLAYGELYINGGKADDKQIIPRNWVDLSLQARAESTRQRERFYGYGWWLRKMAGFDTRYAWGYGGQFVVIVPELDLVVVATSDARPGDDRRRHTRAMYDLLEDYIVAAVARMEG